MTIRPGEPLPAVPSPQETKPAPARSQRASRAAKSPASPDRVELSPTARKMRRAVQALSEAPEVRHAKVQELQRAVERGTYHVPADQLAEKILQETLRETLP